MESNMDVLHDLQQRLRDSAYKVLALYHFFRHQSSDAGMYTSCSDASYGIGLLLKDLGNEMNQVANALEEYQLKRNQKSKGRK